MIRGRHPLTLITLCVVVIHVSALTLINVASSTPGKETLSPSGKHWITARLTALPPKAKPIDTPAAAPADSAPPDSEPEPPTHQEAVQDNADVYIPRHQLTQGPMPTEPVVVPYPEQANETGKYTTILALFIDEVGRVRRVRIDGPSLPKSMEDIAQATFLQARFHPGEIEGHPVKSLMRVEVVFDNTPVPPPASSHSNNPG